MLKIRDRVYYNILSNIRDRIWASYDIRSTRWSITKRKICDRICDRIEYNLFERLGECK